jgi:hypothetical protein
MNMTDVVPTDGDREIDLAGMLRGVERRQKDATMLQACTLAAVCRRAIHAEKLVAELSAEVVRLQTIIDGLTGPPELGPAALAVRDRAKGGGA